MKNFLKEFEIDSPGKLVGGNVADYKKIVIDKSASEYKIVNFADEDFYVNEYKIKKIIEKLNKELFFQELDDDQENEEQVFSTVVSTLAIEGEQYSNKAIKPNNVSNSEVTSESKISIEDKKDQKLIDFISMSAKNIYNDIVSSKEYLQLSSDKEKMSFIKTKATGITNQFIYINSKMNNFKLEIKDSLIWCIYGLLTLNEQLQMDEKNKLNYSYRKDDVEIVSSGITIAKGIKPSKISSAMNDLYKIQFNNNFNLIEKAWLTKFFFVWIHPFYDFNGRTSRFLMKKIIIEDKELRHSYYFDELIIATRSKYYNAIQYSRETKDLTYILAYGYSLLGFIKQSMYISQKINIKHPFLTKIQKRYIRFIGYSVNNFTAEDLMKFIYGEKNQQSVLKMLNELESLGILISRSEGKNKVFSIKDEFK